MDTNKTTLERAFELARSGRYHGISELKRAISAEGYTASQLDGPSLRRQLNDLMKAANQPAKS